MEVISKDIQKLLSLATKTVNTPVTVPSQSKVSLPSKDLSIGQLAELLSILAAEYGTTLPVIIRKLDRVSGDIKALDRIYTQKDDKVEWTHQEDELLVKNPSILVRWKGEEAVELRKRYLGSRGK